MLPDFGELDPFYPVRTVASQASGYLDNATGSSHASENHSVSIRKLHAHVTQVKHLSLPATLVVNGALITIEFRAKTIYAELRLTLPNSPDRLHRPLQSNHRL